jgi:hypothetical protein
MIHAINGVDSVSIGRGKGMMDFEPNLRDMVPDIFIVNKDGDRVKKQKLCEELGIKYIVLSRTPPLGIVPHSSTEVKGRLCLYRTG